MTLGDQIRAQLKEKADQEKAAQEIQQALANEKALLDKQKTDLTILHFKEWLEQDFKVLATQALQAHLKDKYKPNYVAVEFISYMENRVYDRKIILDLFKQHGIPAHLEEVSDSSEMYPNSTTTIVAVPLATIP